MIQPRQPLFRRGDLDHDDDDDNNNNNNGSSSSNKLRIRGRHLVANIQQQEPNQNQLNNNNNNTTIRKGQLLWVERPLLVLQSRMNVQQQRQSIQICSCCYSFLGTPDTALLHSCKRSYQIQLLQMEYVVQQQGEDDDDDEEEKEEEQLDENQAEKENENENDDNQEGKQEEQEGSKQSNTFNQKDRIQQEIERLDKELEMCQNQNNHHFMTPCRYHCGHVYCNSTCEQDAWQMYHYCLCTGWIPEPEIEIELEQEEEEEEKEENNIENDMMETFDDDHNDHESSDSNLIDNVDSMIVEKKEDEEEKDPNNVQQNQQQSQHHPLIQFKQYAIETNEILLLIAEWWLREHSYHNILTTTNTTLSTSTTLLSPYQDFQMNPWWDVVQNDTHEMTTTTTTTAPSPMPNSTTNTTTSTTITTTENTTNTNISLSDSGVPAPPIPSIEPEVSLQQATHQICEEAARLLNQVFQLYNDSLHIVDNNQIPNKNKQPNRMDLFRHTNDGNDENHHHHHDDNTNTIDPSSSSFDSRNVPIPYITSYDISIRIGSCEQNSMGIRQRNPLCRSIFDIDVRQRRHYEIIQLLYENGYLHSLPSSPDEDDNDNDNEDLQKRNDENNMDHEDNDKNDRNQDVDSRKIENGSLNVSWANNRRCMKSDCIDCDDDEDCDNDDNDSSNNNNNDHDDSNNILAIDLAEQYTVDDIAAILARLDFDEGQHVRDIATTTTTAGVLTPTPTTSSGLFEYDRQKDTAMTSTNNNVRTSDDNNNNTNDDLENRGDNHGRSDNNSGDDFDILFPPLDGTAMYSIACKMNHSCDPNVIVLYNAHSQYSNMNHNNSNSGMGHSSSSSSSSTSPLVAYCIALKDITENEELTISYIEANQSYTERQRTLEKYYGFVCECTRCQNEKNTYETKSSYKGDEHNETNDQEYQEEDQIQQLDESHDDTPPDHEFIENEEEEEDNANNDDDEESNKSSLDEGEKQLQQRIERIDTAANHSSYGAIPIECLEPVFTFIVQCGTRTMKEYVPSSPPFIVGDVVDDDDKLSSKKDQEQVMVVTKLLQQCVQAVQDCDYCMCQIVGTDLSDTLYSMLLSRGYWIHDTLYRSTFWCSTLTACIGYGHKGHFLDALRIFDRGFLLGLPSDDPNIYPFFTYIESHGKEMATGPCLPYFTCLVPDYSVMLEQVIITECFPKNYSLQQHRIKEDTTTVPSNEVFQSHYVQQSRPIVVRHYASKWDAIGQWRDLHHYWTKHYGHRYVPIEVGSKTTMSGSSRSSSRTNAMKGEVQLFRNFIEQYLVPSSRQLFHPLTNKNNNHSTDNNSNHHDTTTTKIGYLVKHPLLSQLTGLQYDGGVMTHPTLLCDRTVSHIHVSMGTGGTRTPLHYDRYDTLLVQLVGTQYVRLYSPDQTPYLYPVVGSEKNEKPGSDHPTTSSSTTTTSTIHYDASQEGNTSPLNCELEDYHLHPSGMKAQYVEMILVPGDCLFIPSQTWHYVRSLSTSMSIHYGF